jgi:hypothetical protein
LRNGTTVTAPTPERLAHLEEVEAAAITYFQVIDRAGDLPDLTDYDEQRRYRLAVEDAKLLLRRLVT